MTAPSPNLAGIAPSATLEMTARASLLAGERGRPVLSLSAGEPDFDTPPYIVEAAVGALRAGRTRYPPAAGLPGLRAAIAGHLSESHGTPREAEEVLVTVGAKQAVFAAVFTLFGPGDKVVVPAPYWVSYPAMVRLARAEPVFVETRAGEGFKLTPDALDRALADGARGVILNSPGNPTGAMYDAAELAALVGVVERRDAWIVGDEIYRETRYVEPFASLGAIEAARARLVLVDGFSKTYAMTGWRVGWAAAPPDVVRRMALLQGHINTNTPTFCQEAARVALEDETSRRTAIDAMREAFTARRALLLDGLGDVAGLSADPPDGAFYLWIDVGRWCATAGLDSAGLCRDLLERERIGLVPGSAFGGEGFVRLSFAAAEETLRAALERLAEAADRLGVAR